VTWSIGRQPSTRLPGTESHPGPMRPEDVESLLSTVRFFSPDDSPERPAPTSLRCDAPQTVPQERSSE